MPGVLERLLLICLLLIALAVRLIHVFLFLFLFPLFGVDPDRLRGAVLRGTSLMLKVFVDPEDGPGRIFLRGGFGFGGA